MTGLAQAGGLLDTGKLAVVATGARGALRRDGETCVVVNGTARAKELVGAGGPRRTVVLLGAHYGAHVVSVQVVRGQLLAGQGAEVTG